MRKLYSIATTRHGRAIGNALAGLVSLLLLPVFHFQLFFFLLQSMGGNGFIGCLAWALVPSLLTR